ncbi:MAG: Uma2 family endonuclease, partial [Myxococcota bacterium]
TEAEYLALEGVADTRHEFIQGDILGMAGAELEHNQVVQNIRFSFGLQLWGRPCRVLGSDQRVLVESSREYFYPDVLVTCLEPRLVEPAPRSLLNPQVIIEVLSPTTEAKGRGTKWLAYRTIPTLTDYLSVSTSARHIEHHRRKSEDWLVQMLDEGDIKVAHDLTLSFADVYDQTNI